MRIFPPPLEIGETEGFTPSKDIFGRARLGAGLTNLVSTISDPTVIAVDGQWGTGKTTFLKMWAGELRKLGFPVVYFDAFENDFAEDAFTAIASEIIALAEALDQSDTPAAKRFFENAKSVGKVLLRSGLKIGVKAASAGILDAMDFKDAAKEIGGETATLTDKYLGELLTSQRQQKDAIVGFREALADLPKLLAQAGGGDEERTTVAKPLVFVIDELDRCRPLFALHLLERMKHFFSVPNVHFILGAHIDQLHDSIVAMYGSGINARQYLQKFVHLTLFLVDVAEHPHERTAAKFLSYLVQKMEFAAEDKDVIEASTVLIRHIAHHRNLSLRAIERIMTNIALVLAYTPHNYLRPGPIVGGLCILKITHPDLYGKAKGGTLQFNEVRGALALEEASDTRSNLEFFAEWWQYCTDETVAPQLGTRFRDIQFRFNVERTRIVQLVANDMIDRLVAR